MCDGVIRMKKNKEMIRNNVWRNNGWNFPNLMKSINEQRQGNHQPPTKINSSRYIPKKSYLKCWKAKRKSPKQQAKNDSLHIREPQ